MIEDGTYKVDDFMEELKVMVNEIIHFVKHSSSKTITVEAPPATTQQEAPKEKKKRTPKEPSEPVVLKCPKCSNGDVIKGKTAWGCSLYRKSCDFLIPMEMEGKKLTQKQVEAIVLKGKTGTLSGFKDAEGNTYSGIIQLDENKNPVVIK